jgi:transcriptional regulator with XRE-family HTH domain
MDTVKIGAYIALCRKTKGMTQQQLADELGITNKAVSKWETGQGMPDITILPVLASILNTTVDDLLLGEKTISEQKIDSVLIKDNDSENNRFFIVKTTSKLSLFFAVLGLVLPYFIWHETKNYTGVLFGVWLELCSCAIFFIGYHYTKNGIRQSILVDGLKKLYQKWLRVLYAIWLLLPSYLLMSLICDFFKAEFILKLILSLVLTLCLYFGFLYWKRVSR